MWFAGAILLVLVLFVTIPWQRLHALWFSRRGHAAYREGRFGEAVRHYSRVVSSPLRNYSGAARATLASLSLSLGEHAQAITIAEKLLESLPEAPEYAAVRSQMYLTLALAHAWRNDRGKSAAALARAEELGGAQYDARAATATAAVLLRKGDARGALAALEHRLPISNERGFLRAAYCGELLRAYALAGVGEPPSAVLLGLPRDELTHLARGWKELEALVKDLPAP